MLLRSFESFEKIENGYLIHGDAADVSTGRVKKDIRRHWKCFIIRKLTW